MTWATVGSPSFNATNIGTLTVPVSPVSTSDILLLVVLQGAIGAPLVPTGGGVSSWVGIDNGGIAGNGFYVYVGKITSAGPSTISMPSGTSSIFAWVQELSGGVPTLVDIDGNASYTSTTFGSYPALVPNFANEIYVGCASLQSFPATPGPGGSTAGFTYFEGNGAFGSGTGWMQVVLQLNVNGPASYSPAWTCPGGVGFNQYLFDCLLYALPGPVAGGNFFLLMRGQA